MIEDEKPISLAKDNAVNIREALDTPSPNPDINVAEVTGQLLPVPTEKENKQLSAVESKDILRSVQELQDRNIERLAKKSASPMLIDRRRFFSKFVIVLLAFVLCTIYFRPIVGLRLAAHAAMAPLLNTGQSIEAQLAYADFLAASGKQNEAILTYTTAQAQLKRKNANSQLLCLVNLKLAQLLLSKDPAKSQSLIAETLVNLGEPDKNTPEGMAESLRSMAMAYIDQAEPLAAYPVAIAASKFWQTGPTRGSEGNLFSDLADSLAEKDQWQLAFDCYKRAYSFSERWGDRDFNIYRLNHMAISKTHLEQPEEALALFTRATMMDRKVYGGSLYYTARSIPTIARCLLKLDRPVEAAATINGGLPYLKGGLRNQALELLSYAYQMQNKDQEVTRVLNELKNNAGTGKTAANITEIRKQLANIKEKAGTGRRELSR